MSNPSDLLTTIRIARAELLELLADLTQDQISSSPVQGDWTVKDLLAHIAAWERLAANRLAAARDAAELAYPPLQGQADVDAFNARVYRDHRLEPVETVMAEFEAAHQQLIAEVEMLAANQLPEQLPFDWAGNLTYQVLISANTHWHYYEHISALEQWLAEQPD